MSYLYVDFERSALILKMNSVREISTSNPQKTNQRAQQYVSINSRGTEMYLYIGDVNSIYFTNN